MKAEVLPALLAAGGGTGMLGAIYWHEYQRDGQMRAGRERVGVRFPAGVTAGQAEQALGVLAGLPTRTEVVCELVAIPESVFYGFQLEAGMSDPVVASISGVLGGLRRIEEPSPDEAVTLAVRLFVPAVTLLRADAPDAAFRGLVAGLTALHKDEVVVVRWALRPGPAPLDLPIARGVDPARLAPAWRRKSSLAGFKAAGLVSVRAGSITRARTLAAHVTNSYRSRQIGSNGLRPTFERGRRNLSSLPRVARSSGWISVPETLGLLGWPVGSEAMPNVERGGTRERLVPASVPRGGRVLFLGRDTHGQERPVALSPQAARHHVVIVGPSGSGKSEMAAAGILSDIAAGHGGLVLDPKRDLLDAVLERARPQDHDRLVVLDPSDPRPVPGLDVLGSGDPDLRTDLLISVLRSIVPDWGIRSELWARAGFRTIGEVPGATLLDVSRLFSDPVFRRQAVSRLRDPLLVSQWAGFEAMSRGEQVSAVEAPMARVMALLSRPAVRAIVAQREPKLDISAAFEQRRWLLVGLAPGVVGESAAGLVGALVMFAAWSAIQARVTVAPDARRHLSLYVDELSALSHLPVGLENLLERSRGLGAGLTLATQSLARVPEPGRSALLANAASLITFRAGRDEATRLSRELVGLSERDIQGLGRFEVAARVATGIGSTGVVVTGRTEALEPGSPAQAEAIRERSAARWGGRADPGDENPSPPETAPAAGRTRRRS